MTEQDYQDLIGVRLVVMEETAWANAGDVLLGDSYDESLTLVAKNLTNPDTLLIFDSDFEDGTVALESVALENVSEFCELL